MRIAIGGIAIECCTFSPVPSRLEDFEILRGDALLARYPFLARFDGLKFVPTLFAHATPGGPVEHAAYEQFKGEFLELLRDCMPLDGLYLEMHGAMFVEGREDAEADWIGAAREVVGPACVISASYDLHGNLSPEIMETLDLVTAYRTAPHEDAAETRERAVALLAECLAQGVRPHKAFVPVPVLLPGEKVMTTVEPGRSLYGQIPQEVAGRGLLDASILVGYAWADEPRVTASVTALATDAAAAEEGAAALAKRFWDGRAEFRLGAPAASVGECIRLALEAPERPVFISDSGDNITAGGVGDSAYVLGRLLAQGVTDAVVERLVDPPGVAACFAAGAGATLSLSLGATLDPAHSEPVAVTGRVEALRAIGPVGRQAVLRVEGVRVVLIEKRLGFGGLPELRSLGVELAAHKIVVVKLGYLLPELAQMAARWFLAFSPGVVPLNVEDLGHRRIRRPMYPLDE